MLREQERNLLVVPELSVRTLKKVWDLPVHPALLESVYLQESGLHRYQFRVLLVESSHSSIQVSEIYEIWFSESEVGFVCTLKKSYFRTAVFHIEDKTAFHSSLTVGSVKALPGRNGRAIVSLKIALNSTSSPCLWDSNCITNKHGRCCCYMIVPVAIVSVWSTRIAPPDSWDRRFFTRGYTKDWKLVLGRENLCR